MISIQLIFASHKRDKSKFPKIEFDLTVGDTGGGPKSDILGQVNLGIRTNHSLDFPV